MAKRPNILLITTDTQRWDTLKCMGNPLAVSPHLDRLASEGILFNNAHTSSPVCSPTRTTLLTGLHTPIHGAIENGVHRRTDLTVFPDLLKEAGYTNIMSGKTHFGDTPDSFQINYDTSGPGNIYNKHLEEHGYERPQVHPNPIPEDLFYDAFVTTNTIKGIEEARKTDAPFFAFCSMISPHGPYVPPGKWAELYTDEMLPPFPRNPDTSGEPLHTRRLLGLDSKEPTSAEEIDLTRKLFYGLSSYCDHQVGRLLDYLEQNDLRENTLVIFTSDHGIDLYDHGFCDKHQYYDNTWRVPFIMSQPGTLEQGTTQEFVIWNDITTTVLGAAGVTDDTMQGFDLYTPLTEGDPSPRKCAVATLYKSCALATQQWKLEYFLEEDQTRLFDRKNDPNEYEDLNASEKHQGVRSAMKEALLAWRSDLQDVAYLHRHAPGGGGHVSKRVAEYVKSIRGTDAEERLNKKALAIDHTFGDL